MALDELSDVVQSHLGHRPTGPDDPEFAKAPPQFVDEYRIVWRYLDVQRRMILNAGVSQQEQQDAKRQLEALYDREFPYGKL
jgi:hypothetical protein